MQDDVFSSQSSLIYTSYYLTLILIYRPFGSAQKILPCNDVPGKSRKPFPFPADSICANAAHSATIIVDTQVRKGSFFIPNMISVTQMCSVVQLMNYYAHVTLKKDRTLGSLAIATAKREQEQAMEDVQKCIRCLESAEPRWIMARKFLYVNDREDSVFYLSNDKHAASGFVSRFRLPALVAVKDSGTE